MSALAKKTPEETWSGILTGGIPFYRQYRRFLGLLPARHRCKNCHAPFRGVAGFVMRLAAHGPYNKNPNYCNW